MLKLNTKLRHVDIHQHWLRQQVQDGRIKLQWVPTADMPADGLTKALLRQKNEEFVRQLNLVNISAEISPIKKVDYPNEKLDQTEYQAPQQVMDPEGGVSDVT